MGKRLFIRYLAISMVSQTRFPNFVPQAFTAIHHRLGLVNLGTLCAYQMKPGM